jgi:hypothetical protein
MTGGECTEPEGGRTYSNGDVIVPQGDVGECLYVVQEGQLEIIREEEGKETVIRVAGKDETMSRRVRELTEKVVELRKDPSA